MSEKGEGGVSYRSALSGHFRGGAWARETSDEKFDASKKVGEQSLADLLEARKLRPKLVAADVAIINRAGRLGKGQLAVDALSHARKTCPQCFLPLVVRQMRISPRWGGSYEQMTREATAAQRGAGVNPLLRALLGYADHDRSQTMSQTKKDYGQALFFADRALETAQFRWFHYDRARALMKLERGEEALVEIDKACDQTPTNPAFIATRGWILEKLGREDDALAAYIQALQRAPWEPGVASALHRILGKRLAPARAFCRDKRYREAIALYDEVLEKYPWYPHARVRRSVNRGALLGFDKVVDELETITVDNPTSFEAFQQLDYALARQGRFAEILPHWQRFMNRVPNHPDAHFERSGTHHHLGHDDAALADLKQACRFGHEQACKMAAS